MVVESVIFFMYFKAIKYSNVGNIGISWARKGIIHHLQHEKERPNASSKIH